jgi:hypothetical protein
VGKIFVKPEQLEKWKETRQNGMLRYVLVSGVLSYGLAMFIAMTFFVHRDKLSASFVGLSAVAWTIGGALFGVMMWFVQERQFRKASGPAA